MLASSVYYTVFCTLTLPLRIFDVNVQVATILQLDSASMSVLKI